MKRPKKIVCLSVERRERKFEKLVQICVRSGPANLNIYLLHYTFFVDSNNKTKKKLFFSNLTNFFPFFFVFFCSHRSAPSFDSKLDSWLCVCFPFVIEQQMRVLKKQWPFAIFSFLPSSKHTFEDEKKSPKIHNETRWLRRNSAYRIGLNKDFSTSLSYIIVALHFNRALRLTRFHSPAVKSKKERKKNPFFLLCLCPVEQYQILYAFLLFVCLCPGDLTEQKCKFHCCFHFYAF